MSANDTVTTTRGGALRRLLLLAGGAVGVGVAGSRALERGGQAAAVPTAAGTGTGTTTVVLHGRDWRLGSHASEPGKRPSSKEPRTPKGRIVDGTGRDLGTFKAANLLGYGGALELQTFDLVDGTIIGIGSAGVHENPFAIVGGTGLYAGAAGTYVARQSPREHGGDGTAEFTLTLTGRGGE